MSGHSKAKDKPHGSGKEKALGNKRIHLQPDRISIHHLVLSLENKMIACDLPRIGHGPQGKVGGTPFSLHASTDTGWRTATPLPDISDVLAEQIDSTKSSGATIIHFHSVDSLPKKSQSFFFPKKKRSAEAPPSVSPTRANLANCETSIDACFLCFYFCAEKWRSFALDQLRVRFLGTPEFWKACVKVLGKATTAAFLLVIQPLSLHPLYVDCSQTWQAGYERVGIKIGFPVSENAIAIQEFLDLLEKLEQCGDPSVNFEVEYGNYVDNPNQGSSTIFEKRGTLFSQCVPVSALLQSISQGTSIYAAQNELPYPFEYKFDFRSPFVGGSGVVSSTSSNEAKSAPAATKKTDERLLNIKISELQHTLKRLSRLFPTQVWDEEVWSGGGLSISEKAKRYNIKVQHSFEEDLLSIDNELCNLLSPFNFHSRSPFFPALQPVRPLSPSKSLDTLSNSSLFGPTGLNSSANLLPKSNSASTINSNIEPYNTTNTTTNNLKFHSNNHNINTNNNNNNNNNNNATTTNNNTHNLIGRSRHTATGHNLPPHMSKNGKNSHATGHKGPKNPAIKVSKSVFNMLGISKPSKDDPVNSSWVMRFSSGEDSHPASGDDKEDEITFSSFQRNLISLSFQDMHSIFKQHEDYVLKACEPRKGRGHAVCEKPQELFTSPASESDDLDPSITIHN